MKVIAVALLALLGISTALPPQEPNIVPEVVAEPRDVRFIGDLIVSAIEDVTAQIREAGLDPWRHDGIETGFGLPVPIIFNTDLRVKNVAFTGLSNILIHRMDYGLLTFRLNLDVSLPEIVLSVDDAGIDVTILGERVHAEGFGRLGIVQPRVSGSMQFSVGIISGITVREINLDFNLRGIDFNGYVNVMGTNVTPDIVNLVTVQIPNRLAALRAEVNELVETIVLGVVDSILNS